MMNCVDHETKTNDTFENSFWKFFCCAFTCETAWDQAKIMNLSILQNIEKFIIFA